MCTLITGALALAAGKLTELQLMKLLITAVGHDGSEATSNGCRCAIDPAQPSPLRRAACLTLPVEPCDRQAQPHDHVLAQETISPSKLPSFRRRYARSPRASRRQRSGAYGGALCGSRAACALPMGVSCWSHRGSSRETICRSCLGICYSLAKLRIHAWYETIREPFSG